MKRNFYVLTLSLWALVTLASCNEKTPESEPVAKTITNLDVSAYDKWVYLSFESGTPEVKGYDEQAPAAWDIAMHRENIKTNGGSALKTAFTELDQVTQVPSGEFVSDQLTEDKVVVDMSQMMQGIIVYDTTEINPVLNDWVVRSGMPPTYTVSENIYVVKTKEGTHAKIKFSSYKNDMDKTGFATFSYEYPF